MTNCGYIDVSSSGKIYYEVYGDYPLSGRYCIWIHGLPLNCKQWIHQMNSKRLNKQFTNIYIDLRGYGKSTKVPEDVDDLTELYVDDILHVYEHFGISVANIVGFASGGHGVLRFASRHSDKIDKMIIINSSPKFMKSNNWEWGFTKQSLQDFINMINNSSIRKITSLILSRDFDFEDAKSYKKFNELMNRFTPMTQEAGKDTIKLFFEKIAYDDDRELMKKVACDTLLICSINSKETPPPVMLFLRNAIPNSHLIEISNVGQFIVNTKPKLVEKLILNFLQRATVEPPN